MSKKRRQTSARSITLVLALLGLCLCLLGATYALWSDPLQIGVAANTGVLDIAPDPTEPCRVLLVSKTGAETPLPANTVTFDIEEGHISLSLSTPLLVEELASSYMLALQYEILLSESSTVRSVTPLLANTDGPADEQLELVPASAALTLDSVSLPLPNKYLQGYKSLRFDVYRQVDIIGERVFPTVFLRLTPESIAALSGDPQPLSLDAKDFPALTDVDMSKGPISAAVEVTYTFDLPIYVQQG